jgi:hypothetical protein
MLNELMAFKVIKGFVTLITLVNGLARGAPKLAYPVCAP